MKNVQSNGHQSIETIDRSKRHFVKLGLAASAGLMIGRGEIAEAKSSDRAVKSATLLSGSPGYTTEAVHFESGGVQVAAVLFIPKGLSGKGPAVPILGPFGFVKEMSPAEYGSRLADAGFITLIFDPRYSGESGGSPRRYESPTAKIADVRAALDYLESRPEVDRNRLGAVGVCQGCSEMIAAAAADPRIKTLVTLSGQYIYPKNIDAFFAQSGVTRQQRIERGQQAKAKFDATGEVEYTEVISLTDKNCGLPWKQIHDWYNPWLTEKWGEKSRWENRYTTMSNAEVWAFNVEDHASRVKVPTLMIHGEMSDGGPEAAQHTFDLIASKDKELVIVPGVFHTRFYDDPLVIDPAAVRVVAWFNRHLGTAGAAGSDHASEGATKAAQIALVKKFYEAFRNHDKALLGEALAVDWVDIPAAPGQGPGLEGMRAAMDGYYKSFPDFSPVNADFIVEGNKVVVRSTIHGTQEGEFAGVRPSGRKIEVMAVDIHEISGGKIIKTWHVEDWLSGMVQMGGLPPVYK